MRVLFLLATEAVCSKSLTKNRDSRGFLFAPQYECASIKLQKEENISDIII